MFESIKTDLRGQLRSQRLVFGTVRGLAMTGDVGFRIHGTKVFRIQFKGFIWLLGFRGWVEGCTGPRVFRVSEVWGRAFWSACLFRNDVGLHQLDPCLRFHPTPHTK